MPSRKPSNASSAPAATTGSGGETHQTAGATKPALTTNQGIVP
jgi:hypothetical protein